jgi:hypothetical protein
MSEENKIQDEDELLPEYDFSKMGPPQRGKYAERYHTGTNLIHLDPDVAAVFKSEEAVNQALRLLINVAREQLKLVS